MASRNKLQEQVYTTLLQELTGCLTFQQLVNRLHAKPDWKHVSPFDLRGVLRIAGHAGRRGAGRVWPTHGSPATRSALRGSAAQGRHVPDRMASRSRRAVD